MPHKGKVTYPDCTGAPGNAKFQGGGSRGKSASLNNKNLDSKCKNVGTPRDKGVNR